MPHNNPGYDIESLDGGHLDFIEVKGRVAGADTFDVTRTEVFTALNKQQRSILALVARPRRRHHRGALPPPAVRRSSTSPADDVGAYVANWQPFWDRAERRLMAKRKAHRGRPPARRDQRGVQGRQGPQDRHDPQPSQVVRADAAARVARAALRRARRRSRGRARARPALRLIERLVENGGDAAADADVSPRLEREIERCWPDGVPPVLDPFCGGGSTLVEAQRLGCETFGSDLNPVPVLITQVLTELVPDVAGTRSALYEQTRLRVGLRRPL